MEAVLCDHANEVPALCRCSPYCSCKSRACRVQDVVLDIASSKMPDPVMVQDEPWIKDLVIADIEGRAEFGKKKYGKYLQAHDGRDPLLDAYTEAVDLTKYLRKCIKEKYGR